MRAKLVLACALLVLMAVPVRSHQLDHRDPDDVRGRLDIRRVEWFNGSGRVMITIRTYERFRNTDLQTFNGHAGIDFDTRGGPRQDRYVRFGYNEDEGLWCALYNNRDRWVGRNEIATRGARELVCSFARRHLGIERHLRWRVHTSNGNLIQTFDEAPRGGGWFAH